MFALLQQVPGSLQNKTAHTKLSLSHGNGYAHKMEAASLSLRPCLGEEERRGAKTGSHAAQDGLELILIEGSLA